MRTVGEQIGRRVIVAVAVAVVLAALKHFARAELMYEDFEEYFGEPMSPEVIPPAISAGVTPFEVITIEDTSGFVDGRARLDDNHSALAGMSYYIAGKADTVLTPLSALPTASGSVTSWDLGNFNLGTGAMSFVLDFSGPMGSSVSLFRLACLLGMSVCWCFIIAHTIRAYM